MKSSIAVLALAATAGLVQAAPPSRPATAVFVPAQTQTPPQAPAQAQQAQAPEPGTPQRSKMKVCNADAKAHALHGDDRRAFMKQCLSGKAKAPAR